MLGRTARERASTVRMIRAELTVVHGRYVDDLSLAKMFSIVGDAGLVADAVRLWPRPAWVERLLGPYPASLELANPLDTADPGEWGGAGEGT